MIEFNNLTNTHFQNNKIVDGEPAAIPAAHKTFACTASNNAEMPTNVKTVKQYIEDKKSDLEKDRETAKKKAKLLNTLFTVAAVCLLLLAIALPITGIMIESGALMIVGLGFPLAGLCIFSPLAIKSKSETYKAERLSNQIKQLQELQDNKNLELYLNSEIPMEKKNDILEALEKYHTDQKRNNELTASIQKIEAKKPSVEESQATLDALLQ